MSELRTEAGLLIQTLESRLLELRSLIPAAAHPDVGADPVFATEPDASTEPAVATAPTGPTESAAPTAAVGASCTGCPLCTLMAVLRGERPDLAGALLDGAVTALQLVRGLVAEPPLPTPQPTADGTPAEQPTADSKPAEQPTADQPTADRPTADGRPVDPGSMPEAAPPAASQRRPPERIRIS